MIMNDRFLNGDTSFVVTFKEPIKISYIYLLPTNFATDDLAIQQDTKIGQV